MLNQRLLHANRDDIDALQMLLEQAPGYSLTIQNRLPAPGDAEQALLDLPPGKTMDDKHFYAYLLHDNVIGCADLLRGYPEPDIAYIGLLLFAESHQGCGYGTLALENLRAQARHWNCGTLRIAVVEKNTQALKFWRRAGFAELYRTPAPEYTGDAVVMQATA
ncbi:GNAT family N-acetyltransferase [Acidihalobacter prosperus]|uniref:GNAT family N-acetyltransferase n=1 Tax=Acidihalobacter prosperus TaxID=160660 RepID=A0A1A6C2A1_9GAMM|nr:GNAT family N-acetyltransferase [Acidihalobacter prosperus]